MTQGEYRKLPLYLYRETRERTSDWVCYSLTPDDPDDDDDHTMEEYLVELIMTLLGGTLATHELLLGVGEFLYRKWFKNHYGRHWVQYTADYRRKLSESGWDQGWVDITREKDIKYQAVCHYLREIIPNGDAALLKDVYPSVDGRMRNEYEYTKHQGTRNTYSKLMVRELLITSGYRMNYSLTESLEEIQKKLVPENKAISFWTDSSSINSINRFYVHINPALYPEELLIERVKQVMQKYGRELEIYL